MSFAIPAISSAYAYRPVYSGYTQAAARTSKAAALGFAAPVSAVPETYTNAQTKRVRPTLEQISNEVLNVLEKMRSSANRNADFLNPKDFLIAPEDLYGTGKATEAQFGATLPGTGNTPGNAAAAAATWNLPGSTGPLFADGKASAGTGIDTGNNTVQANAAGTAGAAVTVETDGNEPEHVYYDEKYAADDINHDGRISPSECSTCRERMYVDGSDEDNVSFKAPGHISPGASAAVVSAHEHEHVANAVAKGQQEGVELLSATVSLQTAVCPECGTVYVAGGTTRTSFRETTEQ